MRRRALVPAWRVLGESPAIVPGAIAVAVLLYWTGNDGGFDRLTYLPGTILLIGTVLVAVLGIHAGIPGGRLGVAALGAFLLYVFWCYASIAWAGVGADAWEGANKTFAYFCIYAIFAIRPWTPRAAVIISSLYCVGVAVIGARILVDLPSAADPASSFREGRLAEPISYPNGNTALFLAAAFPCVYLASRRELNAVARGILLASAGVLVELAVLVQSRASMLALPLVALLLLLFTSGRLRLLLAFAFVGAVVAAVLPRLLAVYEKVQDGSDLRGVLEEARTGVVVSALGLFLVGAAWSIVERRVDVSPRVARRIARALTIAGCAGVIACGALLAVKVGNPSDEARSAWSDFKENDVSDDAGGTHFASGFGSGRYEIWRVAWNIFESRPWAGAGVDNFAREYLAQRRNKQSPLYPHSVELRVLQQTGLIGAALVLAFLAAAGLCVRRALRAGPPFQRGLVASAVAVTAYWALQGSEDWFWEIPALSGGALAMLGLAVGLSPPGDATRRAHRLTAGIALGVAAAIVLALVPPWISARDIDRAVRIWPLDERAAFDGLARARRLNPLTAEPDVLAAVISAQTGDTARQRAYLRAAIRRDPTDWYPRMEIGLLDARSGDAAGATSWIASARKLNPLDVTLDWVDRRVRHGRPPTQEEVDDELAYRAERLTGARQG